jgi:hypothetical protein
MYIASNFDASAGKFLFDLFKRLHVSGVPGGCARQRAKKERCLNALKDLTEDTNLFSKDKKNKQAERFCC